jgi:hypothetical protein
MKDNFCVYLCFPTPPTIRSHTCAYVTRMKDNFPKSFTWYPIHVSVAVNVLGVTSMLHSAREISKVTRNRRRLRHTRHTHIRHGIHVKNSAHQCGVKFLHKYVLRLFLDMTLWRSEHISTLTLLSYFVEYLLLWSTLLSSILLSLHKRIRSNRDVFDLTLTSRTAFLRKFSFGDSVRAWGQSCKQMVWLCTHIVSRQQYRHCTYKCNNGALPRNHCSHGKALNITYSDCVSVAFGIQDAVRIFRFILSYVACLVYRILPHHLSTATFSGRKDFEH